MSTANNVLIGFGFFVILLVVYFQGSKKKPMPTKLNMRAAAPEIQERSLNIIFNYNGHSFDAYQVLGIAAGSSWDEVRAAFEKSISQSGGESKDFYLTAFNAIKTQQKF